MVSNERFTEQQRRGLAERRDDQDRTLGAMHTLESALESATFGREDRWRDDVLASLTTLLEAVADEGDGAAEPDSLLSDVARNQPWLRARVHGIRAHYRQLRETLEALISERPGEGPVDFADLRQRIGWILSALRHVRGRESDLIYEAYFDAFEADLIEEADLRHDVLGVEESEREQSRDVKGT
jgi:hypothetical protein